MQSICVRSPTVREGTSRQELATFTQINADQNSLISSSDPCNPCSSVADSGVLPSLTVELLTLHYYSSITFTTRHALPVEVFKQRYGVLARDACQLFERADID